MKKVSKIALAATLLVAMALTLSCVGKVAPRVHRDARSTPHSPDGSPYVSNSNSVPTSSGVVYEGETYETVVIGSQTWFKRNLNYKAKGSRCYNDDPINCQKYGRLYDWATAMGIDEKYKNEWWQNDVNHRGICPSGWHIPSNEEWQIFVYLPGEIVNSFAALPGGRYALGVYEYEFMSVNSSGYWWSTSEDNKAYYAAYHMSLHNMHNTNIGDRGSLNIGLKGDLLSVRCLNGDMPKELKADMEFCKIRSKATLESYSSGLITKEDLGAKVMADKESCSAKIKETIETLEKARNR